MNGRRRDVATLCMCNAARFPSVSNTTSRIIYLPCKLLKPYRCRTTWLQQAYTAVVCFCVSLTR